jgi:glutathione S-transferase
MTDSLAYVSGSPFGRMARVLVREWSLPVEERELPCPLPHEFFAENPLGQVPVLNVGRETLFPTLIILERLWELAGRPAAYDPPRDRQRLLVTL